MRVGIDMELISRASEKLLNQIASEREKEYVNRFAKKDEHIISLWCAKEAVIKLLGERKLSAKEIEILHDETGRPSVTLHARALDVFKSLNLTALDLSISHAGDYAIAIVIAR